MSSSTLAKRLRRDEEGAAAVEFGLLGLVMIALLMGVLQIGIAMQKYNALRGISADVARYAVVQYQSGTEVTNSQIWAQAHQIATRPPYNLSGEQQQLGDGLDITVTTAVDQRIDGATELNFWIRTELPSVMTFLGVESLHVTHSRPIFVLDE